MAYVDRDRSRETALSTIAATVLVGGIGFGLVTGLAMTVVHDPEHHVTLNAWTAPTPPPPPPPPLTRALPRTQARSLANPLPVPAIVPPVDRTPTIVLPTIDMTIGGGGTADRIPTPPPPQPAADQSSRAVPHGDPGSWVTTEDYPAAALRSGEQGVTGFRLDIGADGRTTACTVTRSSGSAALDQTACRMLMRRARFAPARDAGGAAIAASYASRIEWRVPAD